MTVKPIPDGYHTITPYLIVQGVRELLDFLQAVFDAEVGDCLEGEDDKVNHAEVQIGDSKMMLGEARPDWPAQPGSLYLYLPDVDSTYQKALDAGATSVMEPADQFYGDRNAGVKDAQGNVWWLATHIEDVPPEELQRRAAQRQ